MALIFPSEHSGGFTYHQTESQGDFGGGKVEKLMLPSQTNMAVASLKSWTLFLTRDNTSQSTYRGIKGTDSNVH